LVYGGIMWYLYVINTNLKKDKKREIINQLEDEIDKRLSQKDKVNIEKKLL